MIDVVFLLLVFFMLSSTFLRYTGVDLAGGRSGVTRSADIRNLVIVRVKGGANIDVNGKPVELEQLKSELASLAGDEGIKVAIKPMENAIVREVVEIIERANISSVREVMVVK